MSVNLYSIYDAESGLCLGNNKTAGQISDLFGIKVGSVYRSSVTGHVLGGKYKITATGTRPQKLRQCEEETLQLMEEWEDVTEKLRAYFQKIRKELGK